MLVAVGMEVGLRHEAQHEMRKILPQIIDNARLKITDVLKVIHFGVRCLTKT